MHMPCFYLPFSSATFPLSREDLIQSYMAYEPTYSPTAGVTRNDVSCLVLQHQIWVNEALVSTVAALLE
jgi:hypothetical protein